MRHGAPLGIDTHIPLAGIFPEVAPGEVDTEGGFKTAYPDLFDAWANYASVEDEPEAALSELERLFALFQAGGLTEGEFQLFKTKLLDELQ